MKVVFLDRDGTLCVDPPDRRIDTLEKIKLFPDSIEAMRYLAEHDFKVVIITNQASIAEGHLTENQFEIINNKIVEVLSESGVIILRTYMSPHGSNEVNEWRKPGPGMLLMAGKDLNLELSNIYMVGDRLCDIQAGINAGTKTIMVKTGMDNEDAPQANYTAPDLLSAVKYVVENS